MASGGVTEVEQKAWGAFSVSGIALAVVLLHFFPVAFEVVRVPSLLLLFLLSSVLVWTSRGSFQDVGLRGGDDDLELFFALGFGALAGFVMTWLGFALPAPGGVLLESSNPLMQLAGALVGTFALEFVFRGVFLDGALRLRVPVSVAIVLAAVGEALLAQEWTAKMLVPGVVMGLGAGVLYWNAGRTLWMPILVRCALVTVVGLTNGITGQV